MNKWHSWRRSRPVWAGRFTLGLCLAVWSALAPLGAAASPSILSALAAPAVSAEAGRVLPESRPAGELRPAEPLPGSSVELYLPDLRTLPLADLQLQLKSGGGRYLRLENTIWNSGQGPLELTGEFDLLTQRTRVHQHLYTGEGGRREVLVGDFVWHPTHDHWHFDEFTLYELWTLTSDGRLDQVVASSDKLSYCVVDTQVVDPHHPLLPRRQGYWGCGQRLQGLSVGWGDTYKANLDGQALDLTGLPDGFYALTSTVNPSGMIREQNYRNNATRVYLEIQRDRLRVVTPKQVRQAECDQPPCR